MKPRLASACLTISSRMPWAASAGAASVQPSTAASAGRPWATAAGQAALAAIATRLAQLTAWYDRETRSRKGRC